MNIDDDQATIIPFEYFKPENKEELRKIVLKIYREKDKPMHNKLSEDMYKGYLELLKK